MEDAIMTKTIEMLLDVDEKGLAAQAKLMSDILRGRIACPECGSEGDKDDNGAVGSDRDLLCDVCGAVFNVEEGVIA